jgi:hypothetical protein
MSHTPEMELDYNVFISYSPQDENQRHIYDEIVERSTDDGFRVLERKSMLSKIPECHLFVCIMTPSYDEKTQSFHTNGNVLLELGNAFHCVNEEHIKCFVEKSTMKEYITERPSLLDNIHVDQYQESSCIFEIIKVMRDKHIKEFAHDYLKVRYFDELNASGKNVKVTMDKYLSTYEYDVIVDMSIMFIREKIDFLLDTNMNDSFFYVMHNFLLYGDYNDWFSRRNNQIIINSMFARLIYILFYKYVKVKTTEVINNRMCFGLLLNEIVNKSKYPVLTDMITSRMEESIVTSRYNDNNYDYIEYMDLLKQYNKHNRDYDIYCKITNNKSGYNLTCFM